MKVAGETWQRSQQTSPAAGSYIQPCGGLTHLLKFAGIIVHRLLIAKAKEPISKVGLRSLVKRNKQKIDIIFDLSSKKNTAVRLMIKVCRR